MFNWGYSFGDLWERLVDWWQGRDREIDALIGAQRAYLRAHRRPGDPARLEELGRRRWQRVVQAQRRLS